MPIDGTIGRPRDNVFARLIPEDAARRLAESFAQGVGNDSTIFSLLSPRTYDQSVRFHAHDDVDLRPLHDATSPDKALNLTTYEVKLQPMSAHELARLQRMTVGRKLENLAHEYLRGQDLRDAMLDNLNQQTRDMMLRTFLAGADPSTMRGHDPMSYNDMIAAVSHFGNAWRDENDRQPGDPYGFKAYDGRTLDADPPDKHACTVDDKLERSQYLGNLYAYKTLIVNSLGQPRSYYKNSAPWSGGWRDADCYPNSPGAANIIHQKSSAPLPERCECGFHCWYELPPNWESPRLDALTSVPVVVQIAGDILYADRGVRAQHAKVIAVVDCGNDDDPRYNRQHGRIYPTRAELAEKFGGIPVLSPESVYTWAVVEGLRPASERMQELMRTEVQDDDRGNE